MTRRVRLWITAALTVAATALTVAVATLTVGLTTSAIPPIEIENEEERTRGDVTIDGPVVNLAPTNVHLMGIALNALD